jgi:hypothetical protein
MLSLQMAKGESDKAQGQAPNFVATLLNQTKKYTEATNGRQVRSARPG